MLRKACWRPNRGQGNSFHSLANLQPNIMRISAILFATSAIILSASAATISGDFVPAFAKVNAKNDKLFSNTVVSLNYDVERDNLIVGRESGAVEVWSSRKAAMRVRFPAHSSRVSHVTLVHGGKFLLTDSHFQTETKLWDTKSGKLLMRISEARGPSGATPDPNFYVVADSSKFRLLDFRAKRMLPDEYPGSGSTTSLATDVGSRRIAVGTASGTIDVWSFVETRGRPKLKLVSSQQPYDVGNWVVGLQFSRDGSTLYAVTRWGLVDELDSSTLEKKRSLQSSLKNIRSAEFIESKGILALAGTKDAVGLNDPWLEVISLSKDTSQLYPSNSNLAVLKYVPPLSSVFAIQYGAPALIPLP